MLRLLHDEMGYHRGYYFLPQGCHYRHYRAAEAAACLGRCGYRRIGFSGDSLGRELLVSLNQLLAGRRRRVHLTEAHTLHSSSQCIFGARGGTEVAALGVCCTGLPRRPHPQEP